VSAKKIKNSKLTIDDIAKLAGVSKATVSYVINDKPGVSQDLRCKIKKIIEDCNYVPNSAARGLAGEKTHFIGLVIPDVSDMFYANIIRGVEKTSNKYNYLLNLYTTHGEEEKEQRVIKLINSNMVDGLIIMAYYIKDNFIDFLKNEGIPFVFIDYPTKDEEIYSVVVDNESGAFEATEYLISLGHQKIAFLEGHEAAWDSRARFMGFLKALTANSIEFNPLLVEKGNFTREGGYKATKKLLEKGEEFTAIFASNDQMAIGAVRAIKEKGLKIPDNISIIGFDNIEASSIIDPPLTTVMQPIYEIGKKATEILRLNKKGIKIVYDPAPVMSTNISVLGKVDFLTPNETEFTFLCDKLNIPENWVFEDKALAFKRLSKVSNLIIKLGEKGCFYIDNKENYGYIKALKVKAIDTTAAGDVFNGAFSVYYEKTQNFVESLKFANAASAISVTRKGAQSSIPTFEEVIQNK
jgi:LacI family transcriptional regulator